MEQEEQNFNSVQKVESENPFNTVKEKNAREMMSETILIVQEVHHIFSNCCRKKATKCTFKKIFK